MKKKSRKDKLKYKSKIRKRQRENAESDALDSENDCGVSDESAARMKDKMNKQFGVEHGIVRDSSLEKMSDILLEYAEPFMNIIKTDDNEEYEKAIKISIILWNCSIMEGVGKQKRRETEKILKPMMPDAEARSVIRYMLDRKLHMFPDNMRSILSYDLTYKPDGFNLCVASTIPRGEHSQNINKI